MLVWCVMQNDPYAAWQACRHSPFQVGTHHVGLTIQDRGGFIGQWDDRQWVGKDVTERDTGSNGA
jgi:hypothetical protein